MSEEWVDFKSLREHIRARDDNEYSWRKKTSSTKHPDIEYPEDSDPFVDFIRVTGTYETSVVQFPPPTGININMMPFIMGQPDSVPVQYHGYLPMIEGCWLSSFETGKVGYLTIQEGKVAAGTTQRRPGLHTDSHLDGTVTWKQGEGLYPAFGRPMIWRWGGRVGGLYMASTVDKSTRVWNAYIKAPGVFGDCEHLRPFLGEGRLLQKNTMVWMTDGTPHEALPVEEDTERQFFRLVTSNVDVWYAAHSTPNPLGIVPPPSCIIIDANKFTNYSLLTRLLFHLDHDPALA